MSRIRLLTPSRFGIFGMGTVALAGLLMTACGGGSPSQASPSGAPLVVGVVEARSGASTFYSTETVQAVELAVVQVNKSGGILNRQVTLIHADDQSDPNLSVLAAQRLVDQGAKAILFTSGSASTLQARIVCTQQRIPCIAPTNVNAKIIAPPNNDYVFLVANAGDATVVALVGAIHAAGYKRLAFYTDASATATGTAGAYEQAFKKADPNISIVDKEFVPVAASDATAALIRIRDAKPDVVVMPGSADASIEALYHTTASRLGMQLPVFSTTSLQQPQIWKLAGKTLDGTVYTDNLSTKNSETQKVEKLFHNKYGADAPFIGFHANAWDAVFLLKHAFEAAGTTGDGTAVRNALEKTTGFTSSWGQPGYKLNYSHDRHTGASIEGAMKGIVMRVFKDGKPGPEWSVYQPS